MSKIKFIHTADLHLDTPFKGLTGIPENIYKQVQQSTLQAYNKIIDYCIDYEIDFLLISGDTFDLEIKSLSAEIHFLNGLKKLDNYGIKVYIILGNHDSYEENNINLKWPENTYFFSQNKVESVSFYKENIEVARIYGRSYPTKKFYENIVAEYNFNDRETHKFFKIALLHTNVDGIYKNDSYAPSSLTELKSTDIDYWALGHIHSAQVLSENNPTVVYPGNPQGRSIKETGLKHCTLVEVNDNEITSMQTLDTSSILWEQVSIDISDTQTIDEIISIIEDELTTLIEKYKLPTIVRLTLIGMTDLHKEIETIINSGELKDIINETFNSDAKWILIESIISKINSKDSLAEVLNEDTFIADYLKELEKFILDEAVEADKSDYPAVFSGLLENRKVKKHLQSFSQEDLDEIHEQVKKIALNYLLEEEK